ncbi:NAD(P)-binding protein [Cyathus striatus]|nr:NAD(P)-binding protein [Cyathus striatus]
MSIKTNILMLGVTGYIGGSVLSLFLQREDFKTKFNVTALVRSAQKASNLQTLGINTVVGTHSDAQLVEKLAQENEVIFSMADSDYLEAIQALLRGLKNRFESTGKPPILIHTSGTGVLASNGRGYLAKDYKIYDDNNTNQMARISPTQIHRNVDLEIVAADAAGYSKTYIVIPSAIYGIAKTQLTELGVQNPHSVHIPHLIQASLDRGKSVILGDGSSIWPNVSIEDGNTLYINLYDSIMKNPETSHGAEGYYFGENGEYTLSSVAQKIGEALFELGKASSPDPVPLSQSELRKYFNGSTYIGSTSRCHGNRSRSIGWRPIKTTDDFLASIKPEVEALVMSGRKLAPVPWPTYQ